MNTTTVSWLDGALRRSPIQSVFRRRASRRLAVLAYHGVDDPERFEQHLEHVRRTARTVELADVLDAFDGRRSLPPEAVLITFDDGHRSVFEHGMPLLRERGMPAVAFVIGGLVDSARPFWWSEVIDLAGRGGVVEGMKPLPPRELVRALKRVPDEHRRSAIERLRVTASAAASPMPQLTAAEMVTLEAAGIAIGNHTWSHPCLPRCSEEVRRREIEDTHELLRSVLGHEPEVFAYPDGRYDRSSAGVLRDLGYRAAFLFDHRMSVQRPRDPMGVSRLRVNSTTTLDRFQTIASGLHPAIHRVMGRS